MSNIITTGAACCDCVQYLANGEVTDGNGDDITAAHVARMSDSTPETVTLGGCPDDDCADDCEPWFAWAPCDVCGSPLGGDRSYVTFWEA